MWYKVFMVADGYDEAIVFLTNAEYAAVQNFLNQVKEQRCAFAWVGGHWDISGPHQRKEDARNSRNVDVGD